MGDLRFEFLEHTADLKFVAYGRTLGECLGNAAYAMFTAITDLGLVEGRIKKTVVVEAEDLGMLVHDFLSELVYLFATQHLIFSEFDVDVKKVGSYQIHATAFGEEADPKRHELNLEVKAVTYHDMLVEEKDGGWIIQVLCDT